MASVDIGVKIKLCKDCDKYNKAIEIHNLFDWRYAGLISYDEKKDEILISEQQLMRIIQMVNPAQQPRKISLVSQEELYKR